MIKQLRFFVDTVQMFVEEIFLLSIVCNKFSKLPYHTGTVPTFIHSHNTVQLYASIKLQTHHTSIKVFQKVLQQDMVKQIPFSNVQIFVQLRRSFNNCWHVLGLNSNFNLT